MNICPFLLCPRKKVGMNSPDLGIPTLSLGTMFYKWKLPLPFKVRKLAWLPSLTAYLITPNPWVSLWCASWLVSCAVVVHSALVIGLKSCSVDPALPKKNLVDTKNGSSSRSRVHSLSPFFQTALSLVDDWVASVGVTDAVTLITLNY